MNVNDSDRPFLDAIDAGDEPLDLEVFEPDQVSCAEALTRLAEGHRLRPNASLRGRVLRAARTARPPAATSMRPGMLAYQEAIVQMKRLADGELDLDFTALRQTLCHLLAVDSYAIQVIKQSTVAHLDVTRATAAAIEQHNGLDRLHLLDAWLSNAQFLMSLAEDAPTHRDLDWFGFEMSVDGILADRAFETWLHCEEIRVGAGKHFRPLSGSAISTLTAVAVEAVSSIVPFEASETVEICFTGAGASRYVVPTSLGSIRPTATVEIDAIEFCKLVGGWVDPQEVKCRVFGNETLANRFLLAARSMARP